MEGVGREGQGKGVWPFHGKKNHQTRHARSGRLLVQQTKKAIGSEARVKKKKNGKKQKISNNLRCWKDEGAKISLAKEKKKKNGTSNEGRGGTRGVKARWRVNKGRSKRALERKISAVWGGPGEKGRFPLAT